MTLTDHFIIFPISQRIHSMLGTANHRDTYRLGQQIKLGCDIDTLASVLTAIRAFQ